jgi:hypothetical protein
MLKAVFALCISTPTVFSTHITLCRPFQNIPVSPTELDVLECLLPIHAPTVLHLTNVLRFPISYQKQLTLPE